MFIRQIKICAMRHLVENEIRIDIRKQIKDATGIIIVK